MSVSMVTPIRAETFERLQFDAGILFRNLDYSTAKDAESLAALVANAVSTNADTLMGATRGGVNPQTNFTFWEAEADGKRMSFVGSKRLDNAEAKISGTLIEFTPQNVKDAVGLADVSTADKVTTVQPRFDIKPGDYIEHIIWIANIGSDGLYLVDLKNALSVSGLSTQSTDKNTGTLPFEFTGHADNVISTELPIKYLFFASSAAKAMSAPVGDSVDIAQEPVPLSAEGADDDALDINTTAKTSKK